MVGSFVHRVVEETGASVEETARQGRRRCAPDSTSRSLGGDPGAGPGVADRAPRTLYLEFRRLLDRSVVRCRLPVRVLDDRTHRGRPPGRSCADLGVSYLRGSERDRLDDRAAEFVSGAPEALATRAAVCLDQYSLLDIADIAAREKEDAESVARLYFAVSERFGWDALLTQISNLDRVDRWSSLARAAVRQGSSMPHKPVHGTDPASDGPGGSRARRADFRVRAGQPEG